MLLNMMPEHEAQNHPLKEKQRQKKDKRKMNLVTFFFYLCQKYSKSIINQQHLVGFFQATVSINNESFYWQDLIFQASLG